MLSPTATTVRLFLHVLAACVWVGGQLTLAGLVGRFDGRLLALFLGVLLHAH